MTRYLVQPHYSRLWVEARSTLHPIRAETDGLQGEFETEFEGGALKLDGAALNGRFEIAAHRLKTGNALYDRETERRLEMRRFPFIRGELVSVSPLASNRYRVRGKLSLHGVTQAVEGDVRLTILDGGALQLDGEQTFDMRNFALQPPKFLMLRVYPEVRVRGRVIAQPQS